MVFIDGRAGVSELCPRKRGCARLQASRRHRAPSPKYGIRCKRKAPHALTAHSSVSNADRVVDEEGIREHARFQAQVCIRDRQLDGVDALNAVVAGLHVARGELGF